MIKINDVLYCFLKDRQISIIKGEVETLNKYLNGGIDDIDDNEVRINAFKTLKSTTPSSFGTIASESRTKKLNYRYRLTMSLNYEPFDYISGGQHYLSGVAIDYYLHQERKQNWYWIDKQTHFHGKHLHLDIGGNTVTYDFNKYITYTPRQIDNTATYWMDLNSTELANLHFEVYRKDFTSSIPFLQIDGPSINTFGKQAYSDKVGSQSAWMEISIW